MKAKPHEYTLSINKEKDDGVMLSFTGRLDIRGLAALNADLKTLWHDKPTNIKIDLSSVEAIDSTAAVLLLRLEEKAREAGIPFSWLNISEHHLRIIDLINMESLHAAPPIHEKKSEGIFYFLGTSAERHLEDFRRILTFLGEVIIAMIYVIRHPFSIRWNDVFYYMKKVGVDGFPIVMLISLLIGVIMAFMSSLQLKQFGATTYVAPLVAFAMVRELGPMMTAIIVAGRSGSAFSAEIGSMMINEEVDALTTMGFDPVRFLVLPKVLASIIVVPLLAAYSAFFGIVGGLVVGVAGLELSARGYIQQSLESFRLFDVVSSLIKTVVFAVLISGISCQRGLQVRGGADAVGAATTSAVVSAIFLIILTNSVFAIVLYYIH